jgi:uncharacterized protein (UPF0335 family)
MTARFAKDQLKAFIERVERLEEEKKALADDIRDVYAEAKGNGYDVKALREIVRRRKIDKDELAERDAILDTYMLALGMIPGGSSASSTSGQGVASSARAQACAANDDTITNSAQPVLASLPPEGSEPAPALGCAETNSARSSGDPSHPEEGEPGASDRADTDPSQRDRSSAHPSGSGVPSAQSSGSEHTPAPSPGEAPGLREKPSPRGDVDIGEIPPHLRRDPRTNRAPFMPPVPGAGEPRAPPG